MFEKKIRNICKGKRVKKCTLLILLFFNAVTIKEPKHETTYQA